MPYPTEAAPGSSAAGAPAALGTGLLPQGHQEHGQGQGHQSPLQLQVPRHPPGHPGLHCLTQQPQPQLPGHGSSAGSEQQQQITIGSSEELEADGGEGGGPDQQAVVAAATAAAPAAAAAALALYYVGGGGGGGVAGGGGGGAGVALQQEYSVGGPGSAYYAQAQQPLLLLQAQAHQQQQLQVPPPLFAAGVGVPTAATVAAADGNTGWQWDGTPITAPSAAGATGSMLPPGLQYQPQSPTQQYQAVRSPIPQQLPYYQSPQASQLQPQPMQSPPHQQQQPQRQPQPHRQPQPQRQAMRTPFSDFWGMGAALAAVGPSAAGRQQQEDPPSSAGAAAMPQHQDFQVRVGPSSEWGRSIAEVGALRTMHQQQLQHQLHQQHPYQWQQAAPGAELQPEVGSGSGSGLATTASAAVEAGEGCGVASTGGIGFRSATAAVAEAMAAPSLLHDATSVVSTLGATAAPQAQVHLPSPPAKQARQREAQQPAGQLSDTPKRRRR